MIVGHDDPETAAVARRAARTPPRRVRVVVDHQRDEEQAEGTEHGAAATAAATSSASSTPRTRCTRSCCDHVDHAFRSTGADVVQGGVQLINFHSSWYSLRNCLEYFFWFRSRLHLHAQKGFIPLGGNTVFVRTTCCARPDGWDGNCLAEDCDLGVRLSSRGTKVVVAYDSDMVTREETPGSLVGAAQAAHPLEPGLPPGLPQGRLEATARPSASGCSPATR